MKYVEEVGTGTNKIIRWCKEWKLPEPEFEDTGTDFVLTFKRFHVSESLLEKLSGRQKKAVEYLLENKRITNKGGSCKSRHSRENGNPEILQYIEKAGFPLSWE
ncbi:MAG TPA: hypothetical protein DDX84_04000 [Nitrospiraceae bacterium]|nr:hypothetical protein [Nitrospiraceae bacterium]